MVLVQLLTPQHLDAEGVARTYYPGDWVNVGRATAVDWINNGKARAVASSLLTPEDGVGVVFTAPPPAHYLDRLGALGRLPHTVAPVSAHYERTLLLTPPALVPAPLVGAGFEFIRRWEVAAPLCAGYSTAANLPDATDQDRWLTEQVCRDLRIPVYDTRALFLRKTPTVEALLTDWQAECAEGRHPALAFLRALYRVKPLILALPPSWAEG